MLLLHLETATSVCSAALSRYDQLVDVKESDDPRSHASVLAVFCDQLLKENNLSVSSLDAIAVSKGPGSYTGLRIGAATAKGLCYASGKPLIAVDTLLAMALQYSSVKNLSNDTIIIPMLDARRNEIYTAAYSVKGEVLLPVQAMILDTDSLQQFDGRDVVCIGDGALKAADLMHQELFKFDSEFRHTAAGMVQPAVRKFEAGQFEDPAYFEPFYLKEFAGAIPKRLRS